MESNMDRFLEELLADTPVDEGAPIATSEFHPIEPAAVGSVGSNYRQRLRSYSSFPAPAEAPTTSSDTTSSLAHVADLMEVAYAHSLSDGAGNDQRRHLRRQVRKRGKHCRAADDAELEARSPRRSYACDVCGKNFRIPQSLGGHKNIHKGIRKKGTGKEPSSRSRGSRDQYPVGGSPSNSSCDSEGGPSPIFKGVRCREGTKWVSEIRPPRSSDKWWLGTFTSAEEAAQAYDVALCYFKSETDLNFELHDLCRALAPLPSDLTPIQFAERLREMVKDVSEQIIADRRRTSTPPTPAKPAHTASSSRPSASADSGGDASSAEALGGSTIPELPTLPDLFTWNDFDPDSFLRLEDQHNK